MLDATPGCIHVTIAEARRVKPQLGLRVHRSAWTSESVHPGRTPTRTRIEHSVLDHLVTADEECVVDVLTRATQRRLTTAPRLEDTLAGRTRHPHRSLINDVLADVEQGVHSPLERRFLRDVEHAHGLPCGLRNRGEASATGTKHHDVRYRGWSTVVELDGRIAHPVEQAFRDLRRDKMAALSGDTVLRFGWRDVVGRPCEVAAQLTAALQGRGWPGTPRPCSDTCELRTAA
ncbi:MAG TPA: hypothetical protein VIU11_27510 [Nakamurella sp.]